MLAYVVSDTLRRWLSVRLETLGALAAFAAAVLTVEQRGAASTFGLVLSYALTITQLTSITVCFWIRVRARVGPRFKNARMLSF